MVQLLIYIILTTLTVAICIWISYLNRYLNSNYDRGDTERNLEFPVFKVAAIEEVPTNNTHRWIARYKIECFYTKKKNDVDNITLYFYWEKGKYNVGDELTLTECNTEYNKPQDRIIV